MSSRRLTLAAVLCASLCSAASATAQPVSWEKASTELVSQLALHRVYGLDLHHEVAIIVQAPQDTLLSAPLSARLRGHLRQLGIRTLIQAPTNDGPGVAAAQARKMGAEWLLWVRVQPGKTMVAELFSIEPEGLWGDPSDAPESFALASVPLPQTLPSLGAQTKPTKPDSTLALRATGPSVIIRSIEGQVVAITACPSPGDRESLAVLTAQGLTIVPIQGGNTANPLQLDLSSLQRAAVPTRDPIGQVICNQDVISFFHGQLSTGYQVDRGRPSAPWRPLPGMPHGTDSKGRILISELTDGTNEMRAPPVWLDQDGTESPATEAWPPALSRRWQTSQDAGEYGLSLGLDGVYGPISQGQGRASGYGATARHVLGQQLVVVTAKELVNGNDRVRVYGGAASQPIGPWITVQGEIQSSALIQPSDGEVFLVVAVWQPSQGRTQLQILNLGGQR